MNIAKMWNKLSVAGGIAGGLLIKLLGGYDKMLKAIILLVVFDYITGVLKGIYTKKLSSSTGFKGIIKKIVIFIVIATAVCLQELMGNSIPLREVTIMFFVCNEALSLLENAAEFIPIPPKLKEVLIQLRDKNKGDDSNGKKD